MADKESTKPKRRVKNPESFRERAIKASEASERPKRVHKVRAAIGSIVSPIFTPLARGLRAFFGLSIFRPIGKVLKFIGKIVFPTYFRNSLRELKYVTWPTWKQSRQLTFAVLVFAVVFGATVALVDYGLDKVFRQLLLK